MAKASSISSVGILITSKPIYIGIGQNSYPSLGSGWNKKLGIDGRKTLWSKFDF